MCPQGPTCCTSTMEENLAGVSVRETEGLIREAGRSLQASYNALHRSFDSESACVCVCDSEQVLLSLVAECDTRAHNVPRGADICMLCVCKFVFGSNVCSGWFCSFNCMDMCACLCVCLCV